MREASARAWTEALVLLFAVLAFAPVVAPHPVPELEAGPLTAQAIGPTPIALLNVQTGGAASSPVVVTIAIAIGNAVLVYAYGNVCSSLSAADTGGNSYTKNPQSTPCNPGQSGLVIFETIATHTATSVTVTESSVSILQVAVLTYSGVLAFNQNNGYQLSTTQVAWARNTGGDYALQAFAGWSGSQNLSLMPGYGVDAGTAIRLNRNIGALGFLLAGDSEKDLVGLYNYGVSWTGSIGIHAVTIEMIPLGVIYRKSASAGSALTNTHATLSPTALTGDVIIVSLQVYAGANATATISDNRGTSYTPMQTNTLTTGVFEWAAFLSGSNPTVSLSWSPSSPFNEAYWVYSNVVRFVGGEHAQGSGTTAGVLLGSGTPYEMAVVGVVSLSGAGQTCTAPFVGNMLAQSSSGGGLEVQCIGDASTSIAGFGTLPWSTGLTASLSYWTTDVQLETGFVSPIPTAPNGTTGTPWTNPPPNSVGGLPAAQNWLTPLVFIMGIISIIIGFAAASKEIMDQL